jgi:SNF2 family DNA or RNA helicase
MEEIVIQCKVKNTHFPFAFLDLTNTKQLPSPEFLGMFSIVLTTNQRFTNEWKNGSFEDELKRKSSNYDDDEFFRDSLQNSEQSCPLLKINWLRMIVDEGHSMGRGKGNSAILFASWITAERRWAMTGTPTRQTVAQNGLSNILGLMNYLQHDFFTHRRDGQATWQNLILRGWNAGYMASFCRLKSLLKLFMVRHTKSDIEELPPPQYCTTVLNMSSEEVTTYNTLVCAVQSNLLLTSMEGKTSGAQDSLLQRSQAKNAKEALSNVRLVCAGGTRVVPTLSDKYWDEFLSLLRDSNCPKDKYQEAQNYLHRAVTEQLSACACCGMMLSTLLVFPCGHLVCTECVDNKSTSCVVCELPFDVDDFQRLQPGFLYNWVHNIEEEQKKKRDAPQSSFHPAVDHEHLQLSEGGVGNFAPRNPDTPRRRTRKPGDGHVCEYDRWAISGECTLCWKEHDGCNLMNSHARCSVCYRMAEACPQSESKSYYIIERLVKLNEKQQWQLERNRLANPWRVEAEMPIFEQQRPVKVIVFSQFRKVLNMVGDRLLRRFGTACVAEYWGKFRKQELHKFVHDNECCCMLLGKDGSEGLDLSFVTHIILLEQVWDKSLEHQVVARAWRMGAKGAVEVEKLIAENSVEQTMRRLERANAAEDLLEEDELDIGTAEEDNSGTVQGEELSVIDDKSDEYRRAKLHYLLKGLQLIKNPYTLSFGGGTKRKPWSFADKSSSAPTAPAYPIQPTHLVSPMKRRKVGQVRFYIMDSSLA